MKRFLEHPTPWPIMFMSMGWAFVSIGMGRIHPGLQLVCIGLWVIALAYAFVRENR